jgi:hypothetical protein
MTTTDPDRFRREIARAEAQDAAALTLHRPGQRVSRETMQRRADLYARRRDSLIVPLIFAICIGGGIVWAVGIAALIASRLQW